MLKGLRAVLIFTQLLFAVSCLAREELQVIKDLRYDWKTHEPNLKVLVPYLSENASAQSIIFFVDIKQYAGTKLLIDCPGGYSIYFNQRLFTVTEGTSKQFFSVDSLSTLHTEKPLEVELYSEHWNDKKIKTQVVRQGSSMIGNQETTFTQLSREVNNDDLMIIVNMFIFVVLIIFRTRVYRIFKEYFMVVRTFRVRQKFDLIAAQDPFSPMSIAFMVLYALFIGGAFLNLQLKLPGGLDGLGWFQEYRFRPVWEWSAYASLAALLLILLKIVLVNALSRLFYFHRHSELHFYAYFRMAFLISFVIYVSSLAIFVSGNSTADFLFQALPYFTTVLLAIRLIMIYLILNNIVNVKKMHLISYLCTSELIPVIIIIKTLFI